MTAILNVLFACIIVYLVMSNMSLRNRLHVIEKRVAQMTKQLPEPPFESEIEGELLLLLKQGEDVRAVKRIREVTELSLIDAKRYVDELKARV
ncbi:MAG: hypothetical protein UHX00_13330 [Caryophanon sp.]|nr:hypothetical protein [Caryophanon sp.]